MQNPTTRTWEPSSSGIGRVRPKHLWLRSAQVVLPDARRGHTAYGFRALAAKGLCKSPAQVVLPDDPRGPIQPAGFAHVRPKAFAKMAECRCTGCGNDNCGLVHYKGRHTCGNTVRLRGMPSSKGVCIACYCYDCSNFPCSCRSRRVDDRGGDSKLWQNSGYYGNSESSSSWQTSTGDGKVQGWWWQSSTRQWLRPSGNGNDQATMPALNDAPYDAASIGDTSTSISDMVQLIEDLLARVRALENEVAAMKDAEGKQSQ